MSPHKTPGSETDGAVAAFLAAILERDVEKAGEVLAASPEIGNASIHVASVLGLEAELQRLIAEDPARVHSRAGELGADPLLWLCYSPFHGDSAERDQALAASAAALLQAGADPNTRDTRYGVPALYAVTGMDSVPRIARMLLDAGADPTDGESLHHAAEHFHVECLELLLSYGADVNASGDWGNTPLYFLLKYHDLHEEDSSRHGVLWLLDHGADPNVRSGVERETALHAAVRRGQHPAIVKLLIESGADVHARRSDGRTAWSLARRYGFDTIAALLEQSGAVPQTLSSVDALLAACSHGNVNAARALTAHDLLAALTEEDARLLPEAAAARRTTVAAACLVAGFPVDATDEFGATALHHAAIQGNDDLVRELLARGANTQIRDRQHSATPLEWAQFGTQHVADADGNYAETVRLLAAIQH